MMTPQGERTAPAGPPPAAPDRGQNARRKRDEGGGKGRFEKSGRTSYHWISPILRFLQLLASVCAFGVMLASGARGISYRNFHAFRYLVAGTIISAVWALLMLLWDLAMLAARRTTRMPAVIQTILLLDLIAATFALSAAAAAAALTIFNDNGTYPYERTICQDPTPYASFCARSKAATAMAFIAFFFFLPSVVISLIFLAKSYRDRAKS